MPAYKDSKTGTWFVKFYCKDWTGENKQIKKRGFATKREALDYERNYKIRQENNLDMTFGEFWKLYTEDVKNYVKLNTWLTKEHIVDTKILPYFKNLKMNEITPGDVRKWQNEMVAFRYENGKSYSQTYKKTMHNILSAIFNHACRFYNLKSNIMDFDVAASRIERYDAVNGKRQSQGVAFSYDKGRTWEKYSGNPILTDSREDFRDPKVFRYEEKWVMILSGGDCVLLYESKDLIHWNQISSFKGNQESHTGV